LIGATKWDKGGYARGQHRPARRRDDMSKSPIPKEVLREIEVSVARFRAMRIAAAEKRAERAATKKRARASDPLRKQRHQALHTRPGIEHTMRRLVDRVT
jgi:hypothetical protein